MLTVEHTVERMWPIKFNIVFAGYVSSWDPRGISHHDIIFDR